MKKSKKCGIQAKWHDFSPIFLISSSLTNSRLRFEALVLVKAHGCHVRRDTVLFLYWFLVETVILKRIILNPKSTYDRNFVRRGLLVDWKARALERFVSRLSASMFWRHAKYRRRVSVTKEWKYLKQLIVPTVCANHRPLRCLPNPAKVSFLDCRGNTPQSSINTRLVCFQPVMSLPPCIPYRKCLFF